MSRRRGRRREPPSSSPPPVPLLPHPSGTFIFFPGLPPCFPTALIFIPLRGQSTGSLFVFSRAPARQSVYSFHFSSLKVAPSPRAIYFSFTSILCLFPRSQFISLILVSRNIKLYLAALYFREYTIFLNIIKFLMLIRYAINK